MKGLRPAGSLVVGLLLLVGLTIWTRRALPLFPPHSYLFEWFLKMSPGEATFFWRYLIGGAVVVHQTRMVVVSLQSETKRWQPGTPA